MYKIFDKNIFESLIFGLNQNQVNYCIIGDYKKLPDSINHDIDFWTDNLPLFHAILQRTIKDLKFRVLIDNKTGKGFNIAFYKRTGQELIVMKVDVMEETLYKSLLTIVDAKTVSKNIATYKNFYVANEEIEAVMHLYPLFEWGYVKKDEYKQEYLNNYNSLVFKRTLKRIFGQKNADKIIATIQNKDWQNLEQIFKKTKKTAILRAMTQRTFINNLCLFTYFNLKRIIKPTGHYLAFCGLDGAGKTTILDTMNVMFVDLLKKKKVYYGYWRPYCLPEIKEFLGRVQNKSHNLTQQDLVRERQPRGKLTSLGKLLYYCFDYVLGVFKYVGIHSRGGVVLFDRHYIDLIVHPQRFEIGLPQKWLLFFYRFIPKPDYIFFLWATPEEILKRKNEFTKEQIIKQVELYNKTGKQMKNFTSIETNKTITEEIDEILFHITKKLNHD